MFDNVFLAQDCQSAHFAVILSDGQGVMRVVENGTMKAVVQRMFQLDIASSAGCEKKALGKNNRKWAT